ncbi:hypothetical protein B6N60_03374 [Richelia sinica FACHB-800]|uniref:Glutamate--cysteine ligase n=1 Tax=Richelia sinica FACHB-800 TaxID=1357546 RepID=A0A975T9L0_9NOST|nr:glutamate--cysteine ligase [Richelia sinica]MBD2663481.1 glutamate--cysteine ligase [Richelia sinica FACHB-800]QXE24667.1 hypothetical protein B6N60_03374 [Richelia sinica FACHB-800]
MFRFGIEHEVAFLNKEGKFADFSCTKFADFQQIVDLLPTYASDYPQLRVGDAGIKKKRWYIEGFERFADSETVTDCLGKGIEIRTTIHPNIQGAITELTASFHLLHKIAKDFGFYPVLISFNPYTKNFEPQPPLNDYERSQLLAYPDEQTANIYMVSYGPDLNISLTDLPIEEAIDIGKKFTYYSPYIVPFTYSSPFYDGKLWHGLSVRTFMRTGKRPATLVFVPEKSQLIHSTPALTKVARIPAEVGRIEFKSCDSCDNFSIYAGLLALLKGLAIDKTLPGRAIVPDANLHQISAISGFSNPDIFVHGSQILAAAEAALGNDTDISYLQVLKTILSNRKTKSHELIENFQSSGSIETSLRQTYDGY